MTKKQWGITHHLNVPKDISDFMESAATLNKEHGLTKVIYWLMKSDLNPIIFV